MAPIRPDLSSQALAAYRAARAAQTPGAPAAFPAPKQASGPATPAGEAAQPQPAQGARKPDVGASARPALNLQSLSTFAGLIVGHLEQQAAASTAAPAPPPEPVPARQPERPRLPGSSLDIKV